MIREDIVNLFRQLLQQVQPQTWLVIDDFRNDLENLILAFGTGCGAISLENSSKFQNSKFQTFVCSRSHTDLHFCLCFS
jgi:hypothetical protein